MKWVDISARVPGRSDISCRLRYQNYLERRAEWDDEKKDKLARLYERFKAEMWDRVAKEMAIPWRAAEAMHWELGQQEIAARAGVQLFSIAPASTSGTPYPTLSAPTLPGLTRDRLYNPAPMAPSPYGIESPSTAPRLRRRSSSAERSGTRVGGVGIGSRGATPSRISQRDLGRGSAPPQPQLYWHPPQIGASSQQQQAQAQQGQQTLPSLYEMSRQDFSTLNRPLDPPFETPSRAYGSPFEAPRDFRGRRTPESGDGRDLR